MPLIARKAGGSNELPSFRTPEVGLGANLSSRAADGRLTRARVGVKLAAVLSLVAPLLALAMTGPRTAARNSVSRVPPFR